jgi:hypothetical protein
MKNHSLFLALFALLFTTALSAGAYAAAPTLDNVTADPQDEEVVFDWHVNQTGYNNTVYYGLTPALGSSATTTTNSTDPTVTVTGLLDETDYYYQVQSCDNASACTNSTLASVTTLANCDGASVSVDCDTLEGLPTAGSDLASFLTNLAPKLGSFVLIIGIFAAVVGLVVLVVVAFKKAFDGMKWK